MRLDLELVVTFRALMLSLVVWCLPLTAWAQCTDSYPAQKLMGDLQSAQVALSIDDPAGFIAASEQLERGLQCLGEKLPTLGLASTYRIVSLLAYRKGDEPKARRWARTARELDPDFAWGAIELEGSDPYRSVYESERTKADAPEALVDGMTLMVPEGSVLFLDGEYITRPSATMERYHLLQHISDADGHLGTWIITGNAFPEQFLEAGEIEEEGEDDGGKKKKRGKVADNAPYAAEDITVVDRVAPRGKKPAIAVGILGVLAAGGAYTGSYFTRQSFNTSVTSDDLTKYRRFTNGLVVASGGLLVVGLGVGWWGVALDGGAVIGRTWEF